MLQSNILKAQSIGKWFSGLALEIANARRTDVFRGKRIDGRRVETTGDMAEALLILDSVAYHIAQTYNRRVVKDKKNDNELNRQGATVRQDIRNGISRYTSEMHKFFYPDHAHTFVSTMNPWLVENVHTSRAIQLLLPLAIQKLTSVACRRKGSWEYQLIQPILDELVWLANDLIKALPGTVRKEPTGKNTAAEVVHFEAMKDFAEKHAGFVGTGCVAQDLPLNPIEPSVTVSDYLGSKLNTVSWQLSQLGDGEKLNVKHFDIVRFGGRGYMALRNIEIEKGYQVQSTDFFLL